MKNAFLLLSVLWLSTIFLSSCTVKTPADTVVKPDAKTLQQQADFDQAMIEKSNTKN